MTPLEILERTPIVAALYVDPRGPYPKMPGVDCWDIERDARKYDGPHPVVAHPPCERWGRYWSGGPSARTRRELGDDGGCFAAALGAVRTWGGVLEHPEASHAFGRHGLARPSWRSGWRDAGDGVGYVCCVAQRHYGHSARKLTWLYAVGIQLPDLDWSIPEPAARLERGFHSREERIACSTPTYGVASGRLRARENAATPQPFADLLVSLARSVDLAARRAA